MENEKLEKLNEVKEGENPAETQPATNSQPVSEPIENPNETTEPAESADNTVEQETNPENAIEQEMPRMFTQEEVNKLVGNARMEGRQSAINELVKTYGMDKIEDLGDIVGKSQQFDFISDEYNKANNELGAYRTKEILSNAKIIPSKFDDVKYYMKGKGIEITPQSILEELGSHPEWCSQVRDEVKDNNPIREKIDELKRDLSTPMKKSFITSSANETTSGTQQRTTEEDELNEVREMFNAIK